MLNFSREEIRKVIQSLILLFLLVVGGLYIYQRSEKEHKLLLDKGQIVKGIITDLKSTKRGDLIKYSFVVHGNTYTGGMSSNIGTWIGDSVDVIYYPPNPKINSTYEDFDDK